MAKRKAEDVLLGDDQKRNAVEILPLGAGQEVGRSCIIVRYNQKTVMLDCGIHPGKSGLSSLPFLDDVDLSAVKVALITHFHLDHCAAVPYLLAHTSFKGRLLMTHPTKAIFGSLLKDFCKVSKGSVDEALYTEADLQLALSKSEVLDFHQTLDIDGIKVTPYRAGHVLGAAMFLVEIDGMRCLYTGDYSRLADRHLPAADLPPVKPEIVIIESTYGVSRHLPREEREKRFVSKIQDTVLQGGRVLLPVVALGRAQELLLLLDEYWELQPELQGIPIYQASGLARRALSVFQTYVEMMNDEIKQASMQGKNPFRFRHVQFLQSSSEFEDIGPCVMMATPSMLQSGFSRDLFDNWCEDDRNLVIIADFAVQGTMAREIISSPNQVMTKGGVKVPLKMKVEVISFSAHADFDQTSSFLDSLRCPHVVLVHGEAKEMMRLKDALERGATALKIERHVYTPKVLETLKIDFSAKHIAQIVGNLAEKEMKPGQPLRGVLVRKGDRDLVMHPEDLPLFTKLNTGGVKHRQAICLEKPFAELRLALEIMFEGVEGAGHIPVVSARSPPEVSNGNLTASSKIEGAEAVRIGEIVTVSYMPGNARKGSQDHVVLEWEGGAIGDIVADAVVAVILQTAGEPQNVAKADKDRRNALLLGDAEAAAEAELKLMATVLQSQFGPCEINLQRRLIQLQVDGQELIIAHEDGKISGGSDWSRARVAKAIARVREAMRPTPLDFED